MCKRMLWKRALRLLSDEERDSSEDAIADIAEEGGGDDSAAGHAMALSRKCFGCET